MAKFRRNGVADPKPYFDKLRPFREALIDLQNRYRPFGPDYLVLEAVKKALETAAHHFTGEPDFFALRPDQSKVGKAAAPHPT